MRLLVRVLPWLVATIFIAAFLATYSELGRWRAKFSYTDAWQYAAHTAVTEESVVILGDSITANAPFPDHICGYPIVKAGYGGAATNDFLILSRAILAGTKPNMVVVALGANDTRAGHLTEDYRALLAQISGYTNNIAAVSNTSDPTVLASQREAAASAGIPYYQIEVTGLMPDRVHFNADGYRQWIPSVAATICRGYATAG